MLTHYFKLSIRILSKHKSVSITNMLCLSLGMATLLLISTYVKNELSVDSFINHKSEIYKVSYGKSSATPGPLAQLLKTKFPEIINATHIEQHQLLARSPVINYNDNAFQVEQYYTADASFFKLFNYRVLQGNIHEALQIPLSLILTKNEALKIFNSLDVIGKTVVWKGSGDFNFTVRAVVDNLQQNSSIQFKGLISESSLNSMNITYYANNWGFSVYETYLQLNPNTNPIKFEEKLSTFLIDYYAENLASINCNADAKSTPLELHTLKEVYFKNDLTFDTTNRGNRMLIRTLIILGAIIMILSIINYVNLTTASASNRVKEIGVLKVLGSDKQKLILQYLVETIMISFVALAVGYVLAILAWDSFSDFLNVDLKNKIFDGSLFLVFIPATFILGVIVGIYPAIFLSSQKAIDILQNAKLSHFGNVNFRRLLIIFQFVASITLIAFTLIISKQINYLKNKDLGINTEQVLCARLPISILMGKKDILRENLNTIKGVKNTSFTSNLLGQIEGVNNTNIDGVTFNFASMWVDAEFIDLYDLQLLEGRFFSKELQTDMNTTLMLNESAFKKIGKKSAYNMELRVPGGRAKVIGVVKDFNFKSLHSAIEPMAIIYLPRQGQIANIKLSSTNISATLSEIEKGWNELAPGFPFNYQFLDATFNDLYKREVRIGKAFSFFSIIAIIIAILGTLSLTIYICENKVKEIGIRKINGARVIDIVILLNNDFLKNMAIAFLIACPIVFFAVNKWLQNFAYRTEISWWIFALAGCIVLGITLLTVSSQALRAGQRNPVETLRYE